MSSFISIYIVRPIVPDIFNKYQSFITISVLDLQNLKGSFKIFARDHKRSTKRTKNPHHHHHHNNHFHALSYNKQSIKKQLQLNNQRNIHLLGITVINHFLLLVVLYNHNYWIQALYVTCYYTTDIMIYFQWFVWMWFLWVFLFRLCVFLFLWWCETDTFVSFSLVQTLFNWIIIER